MTYEWFQNIHCTIQQGKAYASPAIGEGRQCRGECHCCGAFLGVDLFDVGKENYRACCSARGPDINQQIDQGKAGMRS